MSYECCGNGGTGGAFLNSIKNFIKNLNYVYRNLNKDNSGLSVETDSVLITVFVVVCTIILGICWRSRRRGESKRAGDTRRSANLTVPARDGNLEMKAQDDDDTLVT